MTIRRIALSLFVLLWGLSITVTASPLGKTREEKIELYKILYGEDAPVSEVRPALSPEMESEKVGKDAAVNKNLIKIFIDEEKVYLPEAIQRLGETKTADNASHFQEMLKEMALCQGTYIQTEGKYNSDKVYTAEVEIFLKYGVPTCIIDYTNYMGFLEEAEVTESLSEEYEFETFPIGKNVGQGQEFFIEFNDESMHVIWGEGSIEYYLEKSSGDALELEGDSTPLQETDSYKKLINQIDESLGELEHQVKYDEERKILNIYVVVSKNGRQSVLDNASKMKESWSTLLEDWKTITEKISTSLTLLIRDGLYDISKAHCELTIVDDLKSEDNYYPQDIWAVIKDGTTEYDFLEDGSSGYFTVSSENGIQDAGKNDYGSLNNEEGSTEDHTYTSSAGERNALQKAKEYLEFMHFSYTGLIEQLEYEGFSHSEAVYGADQCGADWYEQAAGKAKEYLDYMSFSYERLVEQLEYEGFTHEQAVYGANMSY